MAIPPGRWRRPTPPASGEIGAGTVEDAEGAAMSDTLIALHRVPQVLAATLAYEYTDRTAAAPTHAPNLNSPCEEAQS